MNQRDIDTLRDLTEPGWREREDAKHAELVELLRPMATADASTGQERCLREECLAAAEAPAEIDTGREVRGFDEEIGALKEQIKELERDNMVKHGRAQGLANENDQLRMALNDAIGVLRMVALRRERTTNEPRNAAGARSG